MRTAPEGRDSRLRAELRSLRRAQPDTTVCSRPIPPANLVKANPLESPPEGAGEHQTQAKGQGSFIAGFACAIATTIIAAIQVVITRYGALHVDPMLFCAGSVTVAACCLTVVLWTRREIGLLVNTEYLPRLTTLSLAGTAVTSLTLIFGLARIDAVAGVILLESEPVYSLLLATLFLKERPSKLQLLATATILAGIGSVLGAGRAFSPLYAAALVFVTPLFWQTSHILSLGVMPPLTPTCLTGARYIYAAFVLVALLLVTDVRAIAQLSDPHVLVVIALTGGFVYVFGSLTWYGAIENLSLAWTTAFVIPGVPLLSFLFAIVFLGEQPNTREIAGIIVAVCGVAGLVLGADARRNRPAVEAAAAIHQPSM